MNIRDIEYVAVNFLFQLIFVFPLFLGMVMHANEFETKEKQKLTEIKNKLQQIHHFSELQRLSLSKRGQVIHLSWEKEFYFHENKK